MKKLLCLFLIPYALLLYSCAIQVQPGGGPKDVMPPKLLSTEPQNYSTNFRGKDIRFDFDEYISTTELSEQLIVSPLLKYTPETRIKKKSLLIHLEDTLLENTTYTMNFGKGISDNNEGNKLENFQFVFSTGPVVDSLSISGNVYNAFNKKAEAGILVMLYRKSEDSLPFLERPIYFARTSDSGEFVVRNISQGFYKIIGLKETDGNYRYTAGEESIGYADTLVQSNSEKVNLRLFKEKLKPQLLRAYSEFPGKAVLAFSSTADSLPWKWITDTSKLSIYSLEYSALRDTINIWYQNISADSISIRFDNNFSKDTVTLRLFKGSAESRGKKANVLVITPPDGQQHLYLPLYLQSNHPLVFSDFSKIVLNEDSLAVIPQFAFVDSLHTKVSIKYPWKSKTGYSLFIPPSVFKDLYGLSSDSLRIPFFTHSETDYGSLKIKFKKQVSGPCLIQLVDLTGEKIFREFYAEKDTVCEFNFLDAGSYRIKIINDRNKNRRWDTGDYLKHFQPEYIDFYPETIVIRSNWDVEINLRPDFSGK
jgi:hypothetical protein